MLFSVLLEGAKVLEVFDSFFHIGLRLSGQLHDHDRLFRFLSVINQLIDGNIGYILLFI